MTMLINSLQEFGDLVNRTYLEKNALEAIKPTLMETGVAKRDVIPAHSGDTRRYKERPHRSPYARYTPESGQMPSALVQVGYYKDAAASKKSLSITISLEMRELGKNREIIDSTTDLVEVAPNRMDLDLSLRLGFAFASSYTDMDGRTVDVTTGDSQPLCYSAHTLTGSSTTCRNRVLNNPQLSRSALEQAENLGRTQTFDNLGFLAADGYDTLVTTDDPATVNTAKELLQSTADVSAPNAGVVNVYQAKYRHVIGKRIDMLPSGLGKDATKAKYWFLANTRKTSFFHAVFMEPSLKMPAEYYNLEDGLTLDWTFTSVYLDATAIVDWRWLVGSSGDAA